MEFTAAFTLPTITLPGTTPPPPAPTTPTTPGTTPEAGTTLPENKDTITTTMVDSINWANLRDKYFSITATQPSDPNIRIDVGAAAFIDFAKEGAVGVDGAGNKLYKYHVKMSYWICGYSTYNTDSFQKPSYPQKNQWWLKIDEASCLSGSLCGEEDDYDETLYITYSEYTIDTAAIQKIPIGGTFDIGLTASFNVPYQGQSVIIDGIQYKMVGIDSQLIKMSTSEVPAEVGTITKNDPHFAAGTVQSGSAKVIKDDSYGNIIDSYETYEGSAKTIEDVLNEGNYGWSAASGYDLAKVWSHNTMATSTNTQLAGNNQNPTSTLSGTYRCNIGGRFDKYLKTVSLTRGTIKIDVSYPGQGSCKASSTVTTTDIPWCVGYGITNYYFKQKCYVEMDLFTAVDEMTYTPTTPGQDIITPPDQGGDDYYYDVVGGDVNASISEPPGDPWWDPGEWFDFLAEYKIYIIIAIVAVIGIVIFVNISKRKVVEQTTQRLNPRKVA
jgi:hypothetical protein